MALKNILQSRSSDPQTKPIIRQYAQGNLKWNGTQKRIPEIKNKILILTGKDDILTPPSISIEFAEMASDATLVQFESVGHLGEQEIPEEYANEILSFLA
jgi:pimeloyl-ACP methyl ester carboxylesterase